MRNIPDCFLTSSTGEQAAGPCMCARTSCSHMPARACSLPVCLTARACSYMTCKKMQVWRPRETKARERRRTLAVSSALPSVEEEQEEKRQPPRIFELSDAGAWRQHRARSCASSRSRACCGPGRCARMCVCVFTYLVETERKRERERESLLGTILHNGGPGRRR